MRNERIKKSEKPKSKRVYEKPLFEKSEGMTFTKEIWEEFNGSRFCLQCSGCHGCR